MTTFCAHAEWSMVFLNRLVSLKVEITIVWSKPTPTTTFGTDSQVAVVGRWPFWGGRSVMKPAFWGDGGVMTTVFFWGGGWECNDTRCLRGGSVMTPAFWGR